MKALEERALRRAEQVSTEIVDWTPASLSAYPRVVLGTFSASTKTQRWIRPSAVVYPYGVPQTVSELTRDWLAISYRLPIRVRSENRADLEARIAAAQMPLAALARWKGDAIYTDIAQAYRQIIAAVGWDCEYWPQRRIISAKPLKPTSGYLWGDKLWRAMLYSLARRTEMAISRYGKISYERLPSPYENPRIVALVLDVLNGVAFDLHRAGAIYVHTDGAIMPYGKMALAHEVYESWGLNYTIKAHGEAEIYAVGSYRVGDKRTIKRIPCSHFDIRPSAQTHWLRPRFRAFSLASRHYANFVE